MIYIYAVLAQLIIPIICGFIWRYIQVKRLGDDEFNSVRTESYFWGWATLFFWPITAIVLTAMTIYYVFSKLFKIIDNVWTYVFAVLIVLIYDKLIKSDFLLPKNIKKKEYDRDWHNYKI